MDSKIINFINEHHVLILSTSINDQPYCANCFYVYVEDTNQLIFTSNYETRHSNEMLINNKVAANIVLETNKIGKIQGLQITGTVKPLKDEEESNAKKKYLKKFPYAILMLETMWALEINFAKLTDNRLGFGKKIIWNSDLKI